MMIVVYSLKSTSSHGRTTPFPTVLREGLENRRECNEACSYQPDTDLIISPVRQYVVLRDILWY